MAHRIAVGVSGTGSNLRALHATIERGALDAEIALVFADRDCPAVEWAVEQGIDALVVPMPKLSEVRERESADGMLAASLEAVGPELIVLAGYMRVLGSAALAALGCPVMNLHPALLPSFPGAHAVKDALEAGVKITGVTVHFVDGSLDAGPVILQDSVPVLAGDTEETLFERIHAVEHRLLPRAVGLALAGALTIEEDGRTVRIDAARAAETMPVPRRALLSVSDKTGLPEFGACLVRLGFELVSTGGTARALRAAGLPVTDVAAVTGFPEMLDGRVKTLHPRIHGGILADRRLASHREQLAAAAIDPFDLVVVNLYPFAAAADRPGIAFDDLVEEIDIGGPSMVRAAAKNHASVAIVTSPARYAAVLAELQANGRVGEGLRAALAVEAFRHTGAYDARIAAELPGRMAAAGVALPDEPGLPGSSDPYPPTLVVGLEKVETLRYGENPHQRAARYRRPGTTKWAGPFALGGTILQGKALSYNNVLDASGADAIGPRAARPGLRRRQAHQSVRRRRARDAPRGVGRRPGRRSRLRLRRRRGADTGGGRRHRGGAGLDLPGGDRGPGLLPGGAGDPGPQDEPPTARGSRPGSRGVRARPRSTGIHPSRRRGRARHGPGRPAGRPGDMEGGHHARPVGGRDARPGPGLAAVPGRRLERDRAGQGRDGDRPRLRSDEPCRRRPPGRRKGDRLPRRGCACGEQPADRTPSTRSPTPSRSAWTRA